MSVSPLSATSHGLAPHRRRAVLAYLMTCVAINGGLAACTGGGSDAGTPLSPSPSPPPDSASGYVYSSQDSTPSADTALAQFNTQGSAGSAYVGPLISGGLGSSAINLFVQPRPTQRFHYTQAALDTTTHTPEGFVSLLNTQGSTGHAYKGALAFGSPSSSTAFFVKNDNKSATYTYTAMPVSADETAMVQTLNAQGSQGYMYLGDVITDASNLNTRRHLFQKDSRNSTTYTYAFTPLLNERNTLVAELNAQGQLGAVWRGGYAIGTDMKSLYEKASPPTGAVSFTFETDTGASGSAFIQQLNTVAAQSYFFTGPYQVGSSRVLVFQKGAITPLPLLGTVLP